MFISSMGFKNLQILKLGTVTTWMRAVSVKVKKMDPVNVACNTRRLRKILLSCLTGERGVAETKKTLRSRDFQREQGRINDHLNIILSASLLLL